MAKKQSTKVSPVNSELDKAKQEQQAPVAPPVDAATARVVKPEEQKPNSDQVQTVVLDANKVMDSPVLDLIFSIDALGDLRDNLASDVKGAMMAKEMAAGRVKGEVSTAYLKQQGEQKKIDPALFMAWALPKLLAKQITEADFIGAIGSIKKGDAKSGAMKFVSGNDLAAMLVPDKAASAALTFDKREISDEEFIELIKSLAKLLDKDDALRALRQPRKKEKKTPAPTPALAGK